MNLLAFYSRYILSLERRILDPETMPKIFAYMILIAILTVGIGLSFFTIGFSIGLLF
jgi:hypothetical protein